MPLHAKLLHQTRYHYDRPVRLSPQIIRLRPAPHARTPVLGYRLAIEPAPHFLNWQQDPFGNWQARVVFPDPVTHFDVTVDLTADMAVQNPFDFFVAPEAEAFPWDYDDSLARELAPYRIVDDGSAALERFVAALDLGETGTVNRLVSLNQQVRDRVRYLIRMEPGVQTPEETLALGSGSCRDSSWLLVQVMRSFGLAARFVSGYLIQLAPDVKSLDGPSGTEVDFTDLHAWVEVYVPGAGWLGLDPTSGLFAGEGHIPLSATPTPQSAAPISGSMDLCEVSFDHHMAVTRVRETPRVTLPYSAPQWAAIDALGQQVDADLRAGDVRLTMGGEPTFVSLDDPQGPEWNTGAVSAAKERLAYHLALRMRRRIAPDGLLTYGQGKWYPGEPLPRWAWTLYWRKDGQPLWRAPVNEPDALSPPDLRAARRLLTGVAERLDVDPRNVVEAFEDPLLALVRERRLPVNIDPTDPRLEDPQQRGSLLKVFEQGLGKARGVVLPVQRWQSAARWASERWLTRSGNKLFLLPGDSPMGLRLPLDTLPWLAPADRRGFFPADPSQLPPLLSTPDPRRQPYLQLLGNAPQPPAGQRTVDERDQPPPRRDGRYVQAGNVRTAMTVESRGGWLYVFLPPLERTEDFLDLIAAIEDTAAETGLPVRIEGYAPPPDPRLESLKLTPDPGVIEVNVQPSVDWPSLRDSTEALYEDARQARLITEKFLIDGRAVGTGGGNHIVLGGATPNDSPFLRRPDVLASLLRFWQHHPSLSYLFSGLFIGPTSQHPRLDEARDSQLGELELALAQLPPGGGYTPPWQVDRILRHLLADLTGNTHRAEVCIDKLYAPESVTGRLGLVELRGFEMPPHPRMSLATQLLVRALVAMFWKTPYTRPLIHWGTQLHDRFMLGHDIWTDFGEVIAELQRAGYAFEPDWFRPHFEFRFPLHGELQWGGITLQLRHALEPWPTLGEEPGAGGTARYVDSSLERLELRAEGLTPERYQVTCNGYTLPLRSTGTPGSYVAGVRYRAWQPPSCLHPRIGVHSPLVFDLYDRWTGQAVAGCTYHVVHPAGRNYEHFPVNALEAEARRLTRFQPFGHTPGAFTPVTLPPRPESPCTLDLRWAAVT
jgi:uncharacterized protein (DUF2126 family)/transglutaminase-like putative cysteine protease